ncbi:ABC transporter ATP-binding protein [Geovibrio thiophilus]|uniref:ABC transporter ATP-binding protein n=1 Tax=Geovibrio thiophilus TaxID=139438 RepID=A0A410K028_9BACT|nr:ATP-binding cassette domain-containing protein [Geovibrio thiophilus]QAR33754.1 ABC transporter ATP-binding protein [Geovibrio thiophilus]
MKLLELKDATKIYTAFEGLFAGSGTSFRATDGISLILEQGKALGIVGESGSGKTTAAKIICDIIRPDAGEVLYKGENIRTLGKKYAGYRKNVQMIFQDPYTSLNPKLTVFSSMYDGIAAHSAMSKAEIRAKCETLMEMVGLEKEHLDRFPHEFSGGQRQRVSIARALSLEPEIIVADEPVSSLDVSVQAQILNLLKKLSKENNITLVLISHDLAVVSFLCDEVIVMNKGKIVERGTADEVIRSPKEEYTKKLLEACVYR